MGFFGDLIDGIKQQKNPLDTFGKAVKDLGTKPITDATQGPPKTGIGLVIGFILLIPLAPFLLVGLGIVWLGQKIAQAIKKLF